MKGANIMTVFSKNLKRLRLAKNLTQEQAAEALGVSAQSVSRWECGTTLPDVTMLPQIAQLYCVTIDDLYKETSVAYENYAQRLGAIHEATGRPEDFLRADQEYRRLLKGGQFTTEDLRLCGILNQHMMYFCKEKALELFDQVLARGKDEDPNTYWRTRRQRIYLLWEIGRNEESVEEFRTLVDGGSEDIEEWICLIQAYQFAGENEKAWEAICAAERKFPESAMLSCYAGHTCEALGRLDDAFACWDSCLELDPEMTDALYAKAECYEGLGDWPKAYAVWQELIEALERRDFEMETSYPKEQARRCRDRMKG